MAEMSSMYTRRELPVEEWDRLRTIPPYDQMGVPQRWQDPDGTWQAAGDWKILVIENSAGEIVMTSATQVQVHWEPWWTREDVRKNPVVVRLMLELGLTTLETFGIPYAFCTVADAQPEVRAVVEHMGGIRAPGDLYLIDTEALATTLMKGTV